MSTGNDMRSISGSPVPDFHESRLNALNPNRQSERAGDVVTMARRHAHEIRSAAEQEADRILREAERQAACLASERLNAHRRELDRIAGVRRDLEGCLEAAVSALERVRDVSAQADPPVAQPSADSAIPAASIPPATEPVAHVSPDRFRRWHWIALLVWGVFLMSIVLMVSMPPADRVAAARAPVAVTLEDSQATRDEAAPAAPVAAVTTAQTSDLTITLIANQECWLSIATDGGTPRERLLRPAEKIVVQAQDAVTLIAGNAGALSLLINDQPAAPLGLDRQVVTRRITRANYREFLVSSAGREAITLAQVP